MTQESIAHIHNKKGKILISAVVSLWNSFGYD